MIKLTISILTQNGIFKLKKRGLWSGGFHVFKVFKMCLPLKSAYENK